MARDKEIKGENFFAVAIDPLKEVFKQLDRLGGGFLSGLTGMASGIALGSSSSDNHQSIAQRAAGNDSAPARAPEVVIAPEPTRKESLAKAVEVVQALPQEWRAMAQEECKYWDRLPYGPNTMTSMEHEPDSNSALLASQNVGAARKQEGPAMNTSRYS